MICDGREIARLMANDVFARRPAHPGSHGPDDFDEVLADVQAAIDLHPDLLGGELVDFGIWFPQTIHVVFRDKAVRVEEPGEPRLSHEVATLGIRQRAKRRNQAESQSHFVTDRRQESNGAGERDQLACRRVPLAERSPDVKENEFDGHFRTLRHDSGEGFRISCGAFFWPLLLKSQLAQKSGHEKSVFE